MNTNRMRYIPLIGSFCRYVVQIRATIGYGFYLLILLNLIAAGLEGIGILLFIPFLSQLGGPTSLTTDRSSQFLHAFFASWDMAVTVEHTLIILVAAFILKGLMVFCLSALRPMLINRTEHTLRQHLMTLYGNMSYCYVLKKSTGFLGNLIVTEVPRACTAMNGFCRALSALITAGTLLLTVFFLHHTLSVVVLVTGGLFFLLMRQLSARIKRYSRHVTSSNARLHGFLNQALASFKYLQATARVDTLQSRVSTTSAALRQTYNRMAWLDALQVAATEPILVLSVASMFYYTVIVARHEVASAIVSVLFFHRCLTELSHFHHHWQHFASHIGSLEMVWTTETELRHYREENCPGTPFEFQESIDLRDVRFSYGSHEVLQGINMHLPKNTAIAVVGRSGAGKTTLIDLITGVLKPTQGTVSIDQHDLATLDLSRYRPSLGYVGQDTVVFDDTIANNVRMQWDTSIDEQTFARIQQVCRASHCEEFILRFPQGYQTLVGDGGVRLSGGQRQRLAIARELFKVPEILILDEATNALDSQSEAYIQQSIQQLKGSLTLVIVSHRLSMLKHVDAIYVLEQGRIIEHGTFAELSHQPNKMFRRLYDLQRSEVGTD